MDSLARWRPGSRLRASAVLVAVVAVLASACSGSSGSSSGGSSSAAKSGGILRLGTHAPIVSMNPFATQDTLALDSFMDMYPYLVQYNLTTKTIEPDFASSWTTSSNHEVWTFHTQAGAKWSDGTPLTAEDAAWTLQTILKFEKGATAQDASNVLDMTGATATSPTTLQITYSGPVANALSSLGQLPILPEHVWKQYAVGNGSKLRKVPNLPNGSPVVSGGPFVFTKYTQGEVALFQRNPNFYGPKPLIDGFGYQYFADSDSEIEALKSGQIDGALGDPSLPATSISSLRTAGFHIVNVPATSFQDIIINTVPSMVAHRELLNPKVREAIEYATDRPTITKVAYLGFAQPGGSIVAPASGSFSDPAVKALPYSISKANALLNAAGYKMGSNGIRIGANGKPMSYNFLISTDNAGAGIRSAQIMKTDFKKAGINLNISVVGDTQLNNDLYGNHYRNYQMAMWGWDTFIDPNYILSVLTCTQRGNLSDSGYCNPAYDAMFKAQAAATSDAKRQQIVYKMQQMIAADRPYLVLVYVNVLEGWSKKWCGILTSPDGFANYFSKNPMEQIHQC